MEKFHFSGFSKHEASGKISTSAISFFNHTFPCFLGVKSCAWHPESAQFFGIADAPNSHAMQGLLQQHLGLGDEVTEVTEVTSYVKRPICELCRKSMKSMEMIKFPGFSLCLKGNCVPCNVMM